jgi:hypothetical protein
VGARIVAEEKPASGIRAHSQSRFRPFHDDFRRGTRDGRQQPVQPPLARLKFHVPRISIEDQFVVSFRNAQNLVDRFGPFPRKVLFFHHGPEDLSQRIA